MTKSIGLVVIASAGVWGQGEAISTERIREHTRFLSHDLMEGRGVGQRGGDLATEYIASQLALAGARPAGPNGSYFQAVSLVGIETQPQSTLAATAGGKTVDFKWSDEFVGQMATQQPDATFDGEAVFVGHSIAAPEYKWDDFKGADVSGKVLVLFTNEPPSTDPRFFDG